MKTSAHLSQTQRHAIILEKLQTEKTLRLTDLCKQLKISSVTVRKDVNFLQSQKLLFKSHGSISLTSPYATTRPINEKEQLQVTEKKRIAAFAASLVADDDAIILASGTTILQLARHLNPATRLKVLTSSLDVAQTLVKNEKIELVQLGGNIRRSSASVIGPFAEQMLQSFSCNKLFLGVDGIDLTDGCTTTNLLEAHLNQQMMKTAQQIIILADSTKFGKRGFGKICDLTQIDQIITNTPPPSSFQKALTKAGVTLTVP